MVFESYMFLESLMINMWFVLTLSLVARAIYRFLECLTVYINVEFGVVKMLIFKGNIIIKLHLVWLTQI